MNKTPLWVKLYKKMPVIGYDITSIVVAWYLAYWFRFNLMPFPGDVTSIYSLSSLLLLLLVQTACFYYFKVYRGLWRYASVNDVSRIVKAACTSMFLLIPILHLFSLLQHVPRSIFPLFVLILISLLGGARLLVRMYFDATLTKNIGDSQDVIIIGAGEAAEILVRDLKRQTMYRLVGLLDDNPTKRGLEIHGVRVLGASQDLKDIVTQYHIDLILIAIPSARSATMRRIVEHCESTKIPFRTLPTLDALASGQVEINALREVHIEDLLGRDQVDLEWDKIKSSITEKRVLVTGGGGSIGSELCRQIMALNPQKLMIIENSEFNLYLIDQEIRHHYPNADIDTVLLSVTDKTGINFYLEQFKPQIVFHAAAFKHVPLLEDQIRAAVQNNILGTCIMAETSVAVGVEKFILISTDKAVNPTNVMGTTKRIAEIYCQNLNARVPTQFITVRFGNVLGSAGSVVPLFKKQLQMGGPLTVTHPDIERYFMTIPEACQLILQAMVNGKGGEIFVLDMGEPIKIAYLAEQMIRLAGKEPGRDIGIEYTGLRPGEKLYEELFHESEHLSQTEHEKLLIAKVRHLNWNDLTQAIHLLTSACMQHKNDELYVLIKNLVPEFQSAVIEMI